jgi:hypothetical protein
MSFIWTDTNPYKKLANGRMLQSVLVAYWFAPWIIKMRGPVVVVESIIEADEIVALHLHKTHQDPKYKCVLSSSHQNAVVRQRQTSATQDSVLSPRANPTASSYAKFVFMTVHRLTVSFGG